MSILNSEMIIIISNSKDVTSDFVCEELDKESIDYLRLNTDTLTKELDFSYTLGCPTWKFKELIMSPERVNSIWYRRPQEIKISNFISYDIGEISHLRSEWKSCIEGFLSHIPIEKWINHPLINASASSKIEQISRAKKYGFLIPSTVVTQSSSVALEFFNECKSQVIVKPISHGYIQRDHSMNDGVIYTNLVDINNIILNSDVLKNCPTLFQEKINKICDVRINYIDQSIVAVSIKADENNALQNIDIRRDNMKNVSYTLIDLPLDIKHRIIEICKSYQLRFAAIDMIVDKKKKWYFLEINPNGQWAWLDLENVTDIRRILINSLSK